jgi:tRNA(fMet)-specific endonuclease VapC
MARFLLDTNIASYLIKGSSAALDHRFGLTPKNDVSISVISEAELRFGAALLPAEAKLHGLVRRFLGEIAIGPWDSRCAVQYAALAAAQQRKGESLSEFDTMIAAQALADGLTLVTNDKAFARIKGLHIEDWTKGPQRA